MGYMVRRDVLVFLFSEWVNLPCTILSILSRKFRVHLMSWHEGSGVFMIECLIRLRIIMIDRHVVIT